MRTLKLLAATAATLALSPALASAATADVGVSVTDKPDPAVVGAPLTYTIVVSNNGPETASGVQLVVNVPSQVTAGKFTASQGTCDLKGNKLTCQLGAIPVTGPVTVNFDVTPQKAGQLSLTATASTTDTDSTPANDSDTETTAVNAAPPTPTCGGQDATIIGTEGDDQLTGTKKADVIVTLGGNDTVDGLGGNDVICTAAGNDTVRGRGGDDTIRTGSDNDILRGGDGRDVLRAGGGEDHLSGGRDADTLRGGGGPDSCVGGPGADTQKSC